MLSGAAASCGWRFEMPIREMMLPEFDAEMQSTRKLLEALPDQLSDYKPHVKSMLLPNLAGHVAQLPSWAHTTINTEGLNINMGEWVPFQPKTRKEVLDEFEKSVKMGREAISTVSDEDLKKKWTFSMNGQEVFSMPRGAVLRSTVMNHLIHHRAQLGGYLRMLDRAIPGMYGPSADEMPTMTASK
jgi:uncharacterized damage-inducible protein DinB